jgi:hypothetical protein
MILDRYRDLLDRMDAAARAAAPVGASGPCGGCSSCCGPLSLLPIEAHALLAAGVAVNQPSASEACPLLGRGGCAAGRARPFACRTRGQQVLHLDAEGDWTTAPCGLIGRDGGAGDRAVPLDEWSSELFHLDREFRNLLGLGAGRVDLAVLCRTPGRYRALLSMPAELPLASRAAG